METHTPNCCKLRNSVRFLLRCISVKNTFFYLCYGSHCDVKTSTGVELHGIVHGLKQKRISLQQKRKLLIILQLIHWVGTLLNKNI